MSILDVELGSYRLNKNCLGQLLAESEACIAHEANNIVAAGNQLDNAILAKTDFSQPTGKFGGGA
jgi:hypothetical protein